MKTWQERRKEAADEYLSELANTERHVSEVGLNNADIDFCHGFDAGRADALREVVAILKDCGHWGDVDALEKSLLKDLAEQEKEGS